MTAFLTPKGFQIITVPGTKEIVFGKRVPHNLPLTLRVYTGIEPTGVSRGVGEDAIRVSLFWRNANGEIKKAGGSKRVHRVINWKANLQNRLDNWNQDFILCACGAPMVERKGSKGSFLGCCNYPICKNTRQIAKAVSEQTGEKHSYKNTPLSNLSPKEMLAEQEVWKIEGNQY